MVPASFSRRLAFLVFVLIGFLGMPKAHATALADGAISFSNLQITPATGTIVFLDDWSGEAFAQAQNSLGGSDAQFSSTLGGNAAVIATVTLAAGSGDASALNLSAGATSSVNILGTTAQAFSTSRGTLFNLFFISGGSGDVDAEFSVDLAGNLSVLTDAFGQLAQNETIFDLELDGTPVLFRHDLLSIGPNLSVNTSISQTLHDTRTLQFDTLYFVLAEVDSESQAINIPEPSSVTLLLAGLAVLTRLIHSTK